VWLVGRRLVCGRRHRLYVSCVTWTALLQVRYGACGAIHSVICLYLPCCKVLIKQYGQRRLQELGAHKRRKQHLQKQHHKPGVADAALLISDAIQPTCDVIPVGETTSGGGDSVCDDHVIRRTPDPFQRLTNKRNGHVVSYLPLADIRGTFANKLLTVNCLSPKCKVLNYCLPSPNVFVKSRRNWKWYL